MNPVFIVFDDPPSHDSGRFVEVETSDGKSVGVGEWKQSGEYWNLGPFYTADQLAAVVQQRDELFEALRDMNAGWKYIRQMHGDLYGVGWDRAQDKADAAIAKVQP